MMVVFKEAWWDGSKRWKASPSAQHVPDRMFSDLPRSAHVEVGVAPDVRPEDNEGPPGEPTEDELRIWPLSDKPVEPLEVLEAGMAETVAAAAERNDDRTKMGLPPVVVDLAPIEAKVEAARKEKADAVVVERPDLQPSAG